MSDSDSDFNPNLGMEPPALVRTRTRSKPKAPTLTRATSSISEHVPIVAKCTYITQFNQYIFSIVESKNPETYPKLLSAAKKLERTKQNDTDYLALLEKEYKNHKFLSLTAKVKSKMMKPKKGVFYELSFDLYKFKYKWYAQLTALAENPTQYDESESSEVSEKMSF